MNSGLFEPRSVFIFLAGVITGILLLAWRIHVILGQPP